MMPTKTLEKETLPPQVVKELKKIIRETIHEEFIKLRISLIPLVSDEEQAELEKLFGDAKSLHKGKYIDATAWLETHSKV